jgi:RNA-binding protein Musashi
MMDKDTGRPRGFGFVTFESEAGVDACINEPLEIHGKPIEVKRAQPRGNLREEEESNRRNKFRKGGSEDQTPNQQNTNAVNSQAASAGMTPQVMAQNIQRMQQYFAMMQQQQQAMAMSRGMGSMNPAMWQQMQQMMQMQQMQQMMGRGGNQGANPMMANNITPAMMQQMGQQMMGAAGGQGNAAGQQGYENNYEQQMFEQQKYEQQQHRRAARESQHYNQGPYGMGAAAATGGGAPTSWEGMYDDVPQPNVNQGGGGRGGFNRNRGGMQAQQQQPMDPAKAPPANAPTGPKNAGKPGANYRGGGRGGNRGFHPYSRG